MTEPTTPQTSAAQPVPPTREQLRARVLGAKARASGEIISVDGFDYEVRPPSIATRNRIVKASQKLVPIPKSKRAKRSKKDELPEFDVEVDAGEMQLLAVLELTFKPGTQERVFEDTDREALLELEVGGLYDQLAKAANRALNFDVEEAEKNS